MTNPTPDPNANRVEILLELGKASEAITALINIVSRISDLVSNVAPGPDPNPDPAPVLETTKVDQDDSAFAYTGPWSTSTGTGKDGGSDRYSALVNARATIKFTGRYIALVGAAAPHHGRVSVSVDGSVSVVTQKADAREDNYTFFEMQWPTSGEHTVIIAPVGDGVVSLDYARIAGEVVRPSQPSTPTPNPPTAPPPAGSMPWITRDGTRLMRSGVPWWFVGYNSFVLTANCGHPHERMDEAAVDRLLDQHMRKDGHGMLRVFFYRGWNLQRLDHLIKACKRNNVYIMLTLDDAIGGCGASNKGEGWFKDDAAVGGYRAHMTAMLTRYRDEPTIAMWEWFNEPKWYNGAFLNFVNNMGPIARQLDPNHLWCSGTMPPYSLGGNDNFKKLNESQYIDVASLHEYDLNEAPSNHFRPSIDNAAGKPTIVGEFSAKGGSREAMVKRKLQAYIGEPRCCGALFWAWYGDTHNTDSFKTSHTEQGVVNAIKSQL